MTTELESLTGKKEFSREPKKLRLVRFYGGKSRGTCIYLVLEEDNIQLDNETAKKLIKILQEALS